MSYAKQHLNEAIEIIEKMDVAAIEKMADLLAQVKTDGGRIFFLGVGGSAGNCSHAVNDFRKIVGIESYAPTDNVSELTARTNDEGWASIFVEWLKVSKLTHKDMLFIFSVGGGNLEKNISPNLVEALKYAKSVGSKVVGVVGRDLLSPPTGSKARIRAGKRWQRAGRSNGMPSWNRSAPLT